MTDFSYQLYSSRNHPPLSSTLKMLGEAGYTGVEGYGALYASLDEEGLVTFRKELEANGLKMPTAHSGLDIIEGDGERTVRIAKALGIKTIYCPFVMRDDRPTDAEGWTAFGRRLQATGEILRKAGLGFGWHNHDFEFKPLANGMLPIECIFKGGPDLEWEADIAWMARGGADPFEWIENFGPRITAVHVKDIAPKGENADEDGWADVGHGTLPWNKLMAAVRKTPTRYFVMEHDKPADDRRFATRSIEVTKKF